MKVITAIENIPPRNISDPPTIFLAGGITNCPWWQDEIIKLLEPYDTAILLNPRRRDFPIGDPVAAREQITWEYYALNNCTVFSIWFSSGSVQPICMYELGRHLSLRCETPDEIAIGVDEDYERRQDVYIQTELIHKRVAANISNSLDRHARNILRAVEEANIRYAAYTSKGAEKSNTNI